MKKKMTEVVISEGPNSDLIMKALAKHVLSKSVEELQQEEEERFMKQLLANKRRKDQKNTNQ